MTNKTRVHLLLLVVVFFTSPSTPLAERTSNVRCTPTKRVICSEEKCESVEPSGYILLREEEVLEEIRRSYIRCDDKGCDSYAAAKSVSGAFENWQPEDPAGAFLKRTRVESQFVPKNQYLEVATSLLSAYISFGTCQEKLLP